jgi:PHD finger protein 20
MGTRKCIVENCQSCSQRSEDQGVSFHKFPQNCETSQIWLAQCRLKALPTAPNNPYVCSRHFRKADFLENKIGKFMLRMRAIPTIFSWGVTPYTGKMPGGGPVAKKKTHMQFALKPKMKKKRPAPVKESTASVSTDVKPVVAKLEEKSTSEQEGKSSEDQAVGPKEKKTKRKGEKKQKAVKPTTSDAGETSKIDSDLATIEVPVIKTMPINFIPGYRIEAQDFNGAWHSATIMEVDSEEREALIQFDKSTKSKGVADEWIPQDSVRLRSTQPVPLTNKFVEGEKVFARWSDSRKFGATISKVLENDYYTVLFDDGYVKNVRANNISREKRPLSAYEREQLLLQAKASKPSPKKVVTSTKQRPKLPPEINEQALKEIDKDGEWCCHWVNDIPIGKEGEVQVPSGKILTTIVEDWRLPFGWQKHMYQRGNIAGKWDVILQSPMGRVFRNKSDLRTYLEENGEKYNQDIYDFSIHKRRAKDIGVHTYTEEYVASLLQVANSSPALSSPQPVQAAKSESGLGSKITALLHETIGHGSPQPVGSNVNNELMDLRGGELSTMGLDEVYVGALKVKVVENLYCCPKEGCVKTFRKENHLQIHIKHYHEELSK